LNRIVSPVLAPIAEGSVMTNEPAAGVTSIMRVARLAEAEVSSGQLSVMFALRATEL
jgi:hypothetical protein